MVIGTEVEREDDENIYDYVGVPFPEGYIDSEIMFLFMHDDIESIDFVGFINSEVQAYRSRLNELADENKRKQRAKMNLTYALFTDRGDRAVNEDSIGVCSKENEHCLSFATDLAVTVWEMRRLHWLQRFSRINLKKRQLIGFSRISFYGGSGYSYGQTN